MQQIDLLSIPAPAMREYVRDRLVGFTAHQHARAASRNEKRAKRKRIAAQAPKREYQEILTGMRQPTLFDLEPTTEAQG